MSVVLYLQIMIFKMYPCRLAHDTSTSCTALA